MSHDDTGQEGAPIIALDPIAAAIKRLAAIDDPITRDRARKMVMAEHNLSAGAVDEALERERARKAMAESAPPLDDTAAQAEILRLSKLAPLAYARERDAAAKRIGITAGALNDLVRRERGEDSGQGKPIELPDPVPWDKPVDGRGLLGELADEIRRYMVVAAGMAEIVALWTLHAHALDAFGISPRLAITSPRPGCGKTTLLDILNRLVPRPLLVANVSAAAIFRTIEVAHPTLLADEADTWLQGDDALRGILNAGHRRGGSVIRVVGDELEPRAFSTWGACAIAMIGKLPATLADRSIPVLLQRKRADEAVAPFRFDHTEALDRLARQAARWAKDNAPRLSGSDPTIPAGLNNRAADNWRPLLAIADAAGGDWPRRAREIAEAMVDGDQSRRVTLLADIRDIFDAKGAEAMASAELAAALVALEGHDWAEYGRSGKPLTVNGLARLLARDGISPGSVWLAGRSPKGYKRAQFEDAFARYLPKSQNPTARTPGAAENLEIPGVLQPQGTKTPGGCENAEKPQFSAAPGALAVDMGEDPPSDQEIDIEDTIDWRSAPPDAPDESGEDMPI